LSIESTSEDLLSRIIRRDVVKAVRGAAILYVVNTILAIVLDLVLFVVGTPFFFFFFRPTGYELILASIGAGIAAYSVVAYLWARRKQTAALGVNFYILGLLRFTTGSLLFSWGAAEFFSAGFWLRQYHEKGTAISGRDGGDIVVYGSDSLVNQRTSKLIRIGFDLPKSWTSAGLVILVVGIVLQYSRSFVQVSLGPISASNIGSILFIDGLSLALWRFAQSAYTKGTVRLPPDVSYNDRTMPH